MFKKILIANRGEIACRVIKTARQLGIATVAVYSDADADARFVKLADEAWRLGPAPAAESYLKADIILDIARASVPRPSIPAMASCRKMPNSPRPARQPASPSSARRPVPLPPWAASRQPKP